MPLLPVPSKLYFSHYQGIFSLIISVIPLSNSPYFPFRVIGSKIYSLCFTLHPIFLTGEMRRPRQFAIGVVSLYDSVGIFFLFNQMTIMAEKLSYLTSKIGGLLKEFKLVW